MKTIMYALISFYSLTLSGLMLFLTGCDKDDDRPSIVGTYQLTHENTSACSNTADNGNKTKTCTPTDCETLTISSNSSFTSSEIGNGVTTSITGTYVIKSPLPQLRAAPTEQRLFFPSLS